MQVEIWSDVLCPYCYIGKRQYEQALARFEHADSVQTIWRSFQLDPSFQRSEGLDAHAYLAERKGQTLDWSVRAHRSITAAARTVGLNFNFDRAIPANSLDAHRLAHLAKQSGLQDRIKERLFSAYFVEGEDIQDRETLFHIGREAGLDEQKLRQVIGGSEFLDEVLGDIAEANEVGVNAVPFFVIDEKYALAGAQSVDVFLRFLRKAREERDAALADTESILAASGISSEDARIPERPHPIPDSGVACSIDGRCDLK